MTMKEKVVLQNWRIMRVRTKKTDYHVVVAGYRAAADAGFVSTRVLKFHQPTMTLTTWAEEVVLDGPPGGYSRDADRVWTAWAARNNPISIVDVSSRYVKKGKAA